MKLRGVVAFLVVAALAFAFPSRALAVEPPNWVAAIFIAGQNAIGLRWTPVVGATGYKVLRSGTSGAGHAEIAASALPQYFDSKVEPGESYFYVLQAVAGAEVSPISQEKGVTVPGQKKVALAAPAWKNLTLAETTEFGKTNYKVGVFWDGQPGAIAYNIYRTLTKGKDYQLLNSTNELQYVDTTIEPGKTYYYTISALDQGFQESSLAPERELVVKVAEKKAEAAKVKKEKIKLQFRRSKLVRQVKSESWGSFEQPFGIDHNSRGEVYVADYMKEQLVVLDGNGEFLFAIKDDVRAPMDLAIDAEDRVYVVMDRGSSVGVFDEKGRLKDLIKMGELVPNTPKPPSAGGLGCGPDYWYISDNNLSQLYVMNYDKNTLEKTWGSQGKEPNQFTAPNKSFYFPEKKALAIADTFNFRVKVVTDLEGDGTPAVVFGDYGNSVGQFNRVVDVGSDDQGNILTMDVGSQTSQAFDLEGNFKYVLAIEDGTEQLPAAGPVAFTRIGKRIYISNNMSGTIYIWDLLDEIGPPVKKK